MEWLLLPAAAVLAWYLGKRKTKAPPPPPPGGDWANVPPGYYLQILDRRTVLITWHNVLFQQEASKIRAGIDLKWEKSDLPGAKTFTHTHITSSNSLLSLRIRRTDGNDITHDEIYPFSAAEIGEAIRTQDPQWFNGIVLWNGPVVDIIIRLAIKK